MSWHLAEGAMADGPYDRSGTLVHFWQMPHWAYILSIATTALFFAADIILPRGATAAIGYCLVPAIAAKTRRGFMLAMVLVSTVLTWVGLFLEPTTSSGWEAGSPLWQSAFDRAMVTGVIWLTFFLVLRRAETISQLMRQTQALKNMSSELERSNGELASFASVVAHDLRGPLNTVGMFTQLLSGSNQIKADVEYGEYLEVIQAEVTRMSGLILSLLSYARVGSRGLKRQECDGKSVLRDVQRNLAADLERCHVEVSTDPLPVIWADPILIAQLFQNLLENSIKYRGETEPRIHVSATEQPECWLFSVRDNGIGLKSEDSERIFDPFYQTDAGQSRGSGMGLGLATCKRIIELHGGHIHVQSKPGEGATFFFTIPKEHQDRRPVARISMMGMAEVAKTDGRH